MSALTDNTTSGAPDGVEKMKVTAANTKSVNHEKASKPISADDISANMPAKVGTPESVKIKAAANDEVEGGSEAVSSHFLLDTTRSPHSILINISPGSNERQSHG